MLDSTGVTPSITIWRMPATRSAVRLLALTCVVTAWLAPQAHAGIVVRQGGLSVSWPGSGATASPAAGSTLRVAVAVTSPGRHETAHIALRRVTDRAVVGRANLTTGSFTYHLSGRAGVSYRLSVKIGTYTRATLVMTGPPSNPCAEGDSPPAAALTLSVASASPGTRFTMLLRNTGASCFSYGYAYGWERRGNDGTWAPYPVNQVFILPAFGLLPGATATLDGNVPPEVTPGHYRITKSVFDSTTGVYPPSSVTVNAELDIVPPA